MKARRRSLATTRPPRRAATPPAAAQPDLETLNPALLGIEDEGAGRAADASDASVQDPLQDWPEAGGEPDRWLLERGAPEGGQEER